MNDSIGLAIGSAMWLGLLTAISPCPLATNIAAISFVGRRVQSPRAVVLTGLLYTLGRSLAYVLLGVALVTSLLSAPGVSHILQKYMNKLLGPLLILVGMVLLELLTVPVPATRVTERLGKRVERWGAAGAFALGVVFALAFCPASAALFFGSLIPLAVTWKSGVLLPSVYGVSTGVPVVVFALLVAFGTSAVAKAFGRIAQFEIWARRVTGVIFVLLGIYFCATFVFRIL